MVELSNLWFLPSVLQENVSWEQSRLVVVEFTAVESFHQAIVFIWTCFNLQDFLPILIKQGWLLEFMYFLFRLEVGTNLWRIELGLRLGGIGMRTPSGLRLGQQRHSNQGLLLVGGGSFVRACVVRCRVLKLRFVPS